jgi:hypothetical protein
MLKAVSTSLLFLLLWLPLKREDFYRRKSAGAKKANKQLGIIASSAAVRREDDAF